MIHGNLSLKINRHNNTLYRYWMTIPLIFLVKIITNPFDETCHLIEIQYGEACVEEDIERVDYYKPQ